MCWRIMILGELNGQNLIFITMTSPERYGVSNHPQIYCVLHGQTETKETPKLCITGSWWEYPLVTIGLPSWDAFPLYDVLMIDVISKKIFQN